MSKNQYRDDEIIEEQISEYNLKDRYISPTSKNKNIGRLDEYAKEKELYQQQKAKVVLDSSKEYAKQKEKQIDDFVPENIGNAIDSVFSKVDSLIDATGKFFWGEKKKTVSKKIPQKSNPVIKTAQNTNTSQPQLNPQLPKQQAIQQAKVTKSVQPVPEKKIINKEEDDGIDRSPPVTRTTPISDLDLPLEILSDPDLVRYFDQMKLYDKKVAGGLCNLSFNKAAKRLKKGRWGKYFTINYDQLKVNTMMASADAGKNRFNGMLPVYKALGKNFTDSAELRKAIEEDINLYLKTGEGSEYFHKFTYTIQRKK